MRMADRRQEGRKEGMANHCVTFSSFPRLIIALVRFGERSRRGWTDGRTGGRIKVEVRSGWRSVGGEEGGRARVYTRKTKLVRRSRICDATSARKLNSVTTKRWRG